MPEYDVSLYANKKQKTTPESAKEALEALLPVLSDEALDFNDRDTVFDACKAKAEELGKKNGWLLYPLGIALSGKQRTWRRHRPRLHDGPRNGPRAGEGRYREAEWLSRFLAKRTTSAEILSHPITPPKTARALRYSIRRRRGKQNSTA